MRVAIKYSSYIEIDGDTIEDIVDKWESTTLYPASSSMEFVEVERAEIVDKEHYKDVIEYF